MMLEKQQSATKPTISIVIPTFNSEAMLEECLESIRRQDYPKELIEIIIADGGSTDETMRMAYKHASGIFANSLVTGEAGKSQGYKESSGDIVAFIDSDNILPTSDWLSNMVRPFADDEIMAAEPIRFTRRGTDSAMTRYCAMSGANDPLCLFLGNHDRESLLTGKWTGMPHEEEQCDGYLKVKVDSNHVPTIGANGFLIRRGWLDFCGIGNYMFDIDVMQRIAEKGFVAMVDIGIVHIYARGIREFAGKQKRRMRDYRKHKDEREYDWSSFSAKDTGKFAAYTILTVPLLVQAMRGWLRQHDRAWLMHIPACWVTLAVYGLGVIRK